VEANSPPSKAVVEKVEDLVVEDLVVEKVVEDSVEAKAVVEKVEDSVVVEKVEAKVVVEKAVAEKVAAKEVEDSVEEDSVVGLEVDSEGVDSRLPAQAQAQGLDLTAMVLAREKAQQAQVTQ
jgi:hypothetical protein